MAVCLTGFIPHGKPRLWPGGLRFQELAALSLREAGPSGVERGAHPTICCSCRKPSLELRLHQERRQPSALPWLLGFGHRISYSSET